MGVVVYIVGGYCLIIWGYVEVGSWGKRFEGKEGEGRVPSPFLPPLRICHTLSLSVGQPTTKTPLSPATGLTLLTVQRADREHRRRPHVRHESLDLLDHPLGVLSRGNPGEVGLVGGDHECPTLRRDFREFETMSGDAVQVQGVGGG